VAPEARKAEDPHWKKELTADDLRLGAIFDVDTGVAAARTSNLNLSKSNRSSGGTSDGGTRTIRGTVTTWPAARPAPPSGD
jgi:hypothetical protein